MTRFFVGNKPGVGGVLKVMRNNTDDPLTTPNEHYGKFLFNSETSHLAYVKDITSYRYDPAFTSAGLYYFPTGSNMSNCNRFMQVSAGGGSLRFQYSSIFPGRIIGKGDVPIVVEQRQKKPLGVERRGPLTAYYRRSQSDQFTAGHNVTYISYLVTLTNRVYATDFPKNIASPIWLIADDPVQSVNNFRTNFADNDTIVSILDLPADDSPLPVTPIAASGTRNTIFSPTLVRIAKGGADADSTEEGIIADSDHVPLKIVRTGQVNIAPGASVDVMSDKELTENSYMDYIVWQQGEPMIWPNPVYRAAFVENSSVKITYAVFTDKVRIFNRGNVAATVRYIICSDDSQTTTGGSQVVRSLPDGGIQIKKPGSSDIAPKDGDILLDSNHSYLPIVSEGWVHRDSFITDTSNRGLGDRKFVVNFSNDGSFVPYVKILPTTEGGGISLRSVGVLRTNRPSIYNDWASSSNAVAHIEDDKVTFWLATGHPSGVQADWNATGGYRPEYNNASRPIGIRYYIFAIPVSF